MRVLHRHVQHKFVRHFTHLSIREGDGDDVGYLTQLSIREGDSDDGGDGDGVMVVDEVIVVMAMMVVDRSCDDSGNGGCRGDGGCRGGGVGYGYGGGDDER